MFYNRKSGLFFWKFSIHFVPGRPGTEEFVPGFLLLPLSRDKGTLGQRSRWTFRPEETLIRSKEKQEFA